VVWVHIPYFKDAPNAEGGNTRKNLPIRATDILVWSSLSLSESQNIICGLHAMEALLTYWNPSHVNEIRFQLCVLHVI
jgi:hypothetical protein